MDIISIFFVAIGLSMDAFAVAISNGIVLKEVTFKEMFKIGLFFGIFQGVMPVIGWFCGKTFSNYIVNIDHFVAFGVLAFIGGSMIREALKGEDNEEVKEPNSLKVILLMSVATSIDALAVGVSFAMINTNILIPAIMIGVITFIISSIGVFIGKKAGDLFKKKAEIIGGIILILIGLKILIEHLFF